MLDRKSAPVQPRNSRWAATLMAAAGVLAGLVASSDSQATPAAFTFAPPNPGWVVALNGGVPVTDVEGDTPGARDIVGDAANPLLYLASDATHLYFRIRLDSDPLQNPTNFGPFGWGCFINTDANLQTYEFSTIVDGVNNPDVIYFYKNTTTATPNSPLEDPDLPALESTFAPLTAAVGHARVVSAPSNFGGDPDFFMEWAIELTTALANGFNPAIPSNYYCGSANNGTNISADCSGGPAGGCPLDSEFTDPIGCGPLGCAICGDGSVTAGEGCDDGNTTNGDGCNSACLKELGQPCVGNIVCASAFCDPAGNICACDQNADCPVGQLCNLTPNPNVCVNPGCGNGVLEVGEGCDDNNTTNGDGCNSACLKELGQPCAGNGVCASAFCDPAGNVCACDQNSDCPVGQVCNILPNPNVCVNAGCGNFVLELGEGCDDGNTANGDGCNSVCLKELGEPCIGNGVCASSFCDPAGNICACDQDVDCPLGQLCNTAPNPNVCTAAGCGNGVLEAGEGCDDNNNNNGDGCNSVCLKELGQPCTGNGVCASAFCDPAGNICACDQDSDCPGVQLCNTTPNPNMCVNPGCGNGVLEAGEGCDDSNTTNGDGCNSACLKELGQPCAGNGVCASGFCDPAGNICACDQNSDCPGVQLCNTTPNPNVCVNPGCGNGVLEAGEGCDDSNTTNGDGCNSACLKELGQPCTGNTVCASAFCDPAGNICACDQNADCPVGQLCNLNPNPNICVNPGCGNGVLEAGEGCDDNNTTNGDGCNSACLKELGQPCAGNGVCASAFCDPAGNICACDQNADCPVGQLCNLTPNPNVCVNPGCGNGVLEAGEGCDDNNTTNGDGCNSVCLKELGQPCTGNGVCASAFCDPAGNICACDQDADCAPGQLCNTSQSPNVCTSPGCGNGVLEAGEGCDDNNTTNGDGCNSLCLKELGQPCSGNTVCASAFCDPAGNICACDQNADCPVGQLCNTTPNPNICVNPGCGNGVLEAGEGCDDSNTMNGDGCNSVCLKELGQPCAGNGVCASGFCDPAGNICACDQSADCPSGQLCNTTPDPNICVNPGCGNGVLEAGEGCDDNNTTNGDGCNSVCLKELGEPCSGNGVCASDFCDPSGNVCACDQDADCPSGQLCNTFDQPNSCVNPGCGNHVLEAGEGCDDGNTTPGDGCNDVCLLEIGEPCSGNGVCASDFCDPTDNTCACDDSADCPAGDQCNTTLNPNECVPAGCGNGVLGGSEGCDDGNLANGDGCNAQCLIELGLPCLSGPACASGFCDPTGSVCACDQDSDCPGAELCDTTTDPNQCVGEICGNGTIEGAETCDDQNTVSGDGCSDVCGVEQDWVCNGEPSVCEPAPCGSDADCQYCNEQYSICVKACGSATDCPNGFFCDLISGICVPNCQTGAECPTGVCDAVTGNCVECLIDDDCGMGEICSAGTCGPGCTGNSDCADGLLCDIGLGVCVECFDSADCSGGLACIDHHCLPGCNEEADCNGVVCNETVGVCFECIMDSDCPNGATCDEGTGQCIQIGCTDDSQCPDGTVCDEPSHVCVECTQDSECPSGQVCDESVLECVECTEDADCPDGQVCDEAAQVCVGCTDDSDCLDGKVCDEDAQICVQCVEDGDCQNGVCDEGAQTCVECTQDSECTEGKVCDELTLICVGCTQDTECTSGACDETTKTCEQDGLVAEGSGIFCAARQTGENDGRIALAFLGLAGLVLARRRRRG